MNKEYGLSIQEIAMQTAISEQSVEINYLQQYNNYARK